MVQVLLSSVVVSSSVISIYRYGIIGNGISNTTGIRRQSWHAAEQTTNVRVCGFEFCQVLGFFFFFLLSSFFFLLSTFLFFPSIVEWHQSHPKGGGAAPLLMEKGKTWIQAFFIGKFQVTDEFQPIRN